MNIFKLKNQNKISSRDCLLLPPPWPLSQPSCFHHFLLALSSITFVSILILAAAEFLGKHLQYSKFWSPKNSAHKIHLHSRSAMLLCYAPAFALTLMISFFFPRHIHPDPRIFLIKSLLLLHFSKRIFEVNSNY